MTSAGFEGKRWPPFLQRYSKRSTGSMLCWAAGSQATIGDVLTHVRDNELLRLDDRFAVHLVAEPVDDGSSGFENVQAYLACGVDELWAYRCYLTDESPFATHHGVKGAQFERVLVVIDDEEAGYWQYSYGKYLGYVSLSDTDKSNIKAGEESVLDRTPSPLLCVLLACDEGLSGRRLCARCRNSPHRYRCAESIPRGRNPGC